MYISYKAKLMLRMIKATVVKYSKYLQLCYTMSIPVENAYVKIFMII